MSSTLYYRPIVPQKDKYCGDQLKQILIERFRLIEGPSKLDTSHIDYLNGLVDAGITDASKLLDEIARHGKIEIYLGY